MASQILVICTCRHCNKPFSVPESRIKAGRGKFCSKVCKDLSAKLSPEAKVRSAAGLKQKRSANMRRYRREDPKKFRKRDATYKESRRAELSRKAVIYNRAHPDVVRRREEKRRARKLNAPLNDLTKKQWEAILTTYNHRCAYCKQPYQRLEMDHVIPLSKGGSHTKSNVVPACRSCNARKGQSLLVPFQQGYTL